MSRRATMLPPPYVAERPHYEPLPHDSERRLDDPRLSVSATSMLPPPPADWQERTTVRAPRLATATAKEPAKQAQT